MLAFITAVLLSSNTPTPIADVFVNVNAMNCTTGVGSSTDPVCSIGAAVALAAAGDTIRIAPGTYLENVALPFDLDLVGTGGSTVTIVDGGALGSVITIPAAVTVTIDGLTVRNGRADRGGGIQSDGTLTLRNSTVTGNNTTGMTGPINQGGAGVSTSAYPVIADFTIEDCTISENHSTAPSFAGAGGVLLGAGSLTISNSTINANTATGGYGSNGGGISVSSAAVNITGSTISENVGNFYAGGLLANSCNISLVDSTISDNSAPFGAGVMSYFSVLIVRNTTISGNMSSNSGGGILTGNLAPGSLISNSTIVGNSSDNQGPGILANGFTAALLLLQNSIIAENFDTSQTGTDEIVGIVQSLGNNLIGTDSTGFIDGVLEDQVGTTTNPLDPRLGPLQFNGGPTRTHQPLIESPAIDAGNLTGFEPFDQRGLARPIGVRADIGAVEEEQVATSLCNGDGGNQAGCTDCPCGNNATPGTVGGCVNSMGASTLLGATGSSSVSLLPPSTFQLRFALTNAPPGTFTLLFSGSATQPTSPANPCFGLQTGMVQASFDGLACLGGPMLRHGVRATDAAGATISSWSGPAAGLATGVSAGQARYFQAIYRDSTFATCVAGLNTSQAVEIQFTP